MNVHIREAAAQWLVEFRTEKPSVAVRRQFAAWLRTSPEHIKAYLNVRALWVLGHAEQRLPRQQFHHALVTGELHTYV